MKPYYIGKGEKIKILESSGAFFSAVSQVRHKQTLIFPSMLGQNEKQLISDIGNLNDFRPISSVGLIRNQANFLHLDMDDATVKNAIGRLNVSIATLGDRLSKVEHEIKLYVATENASSEDVKNEITKNPSLKGRAVISFSEVVGQYLADETAYAGRVRKAKAIVGVAQPRIKQKNHLLIVADYAIG